MSKHTVYLNAWGEVDGFEADGVDWSPVPGHCIDCEFEREYGRKMICVRKRKAFKVRQRSWCRQFSERVNDEQA